MQDYSCGMLRRPIDRLAIQLALFAGLAVLVGTGATDTADDAILGWVLQWRNSAVDQVFQIATSIGDPVVSSLFAVVLTVVAVARTGQRGWTGLLFFAGIALDYALKQLVLQPGPPSELVRDAVMIPALSHLSPYTFPGGHVMRITFLALLVSAAYPKLRGVAIIVVLLMVVGRVYLAAGWASDVAGGLIAGVALATVAELVRARISSPRRVEALAT